MTGALALFELELAEDAAASAPSSYRERADVVRQLCQRGWTLVPSGPANTLIAVPAWVCASCGDVQPNDYLLGMNGHTNPHNIVRGADGRWLFQQWSRYGCHNRMGLRFSQFLIMLRSGDPRAFDVDRWSAGALPWAPTREAVEALS